VALQAKGLFPRASVRWSCRNAGGGLVEGGRSGVGCAVGVSGEVPHSSTCVEFSLGVGARMSGKKGMGAEGWGGEETECI